MHIGLYHGYELSGSGSNEYTRYLARYFVEAGHQVHIICREKSPENIPYISQAYAWDQNGACQELFQRQNEGQLCVLHQLSHGDIRPVYLTDKQREGQVKSFIALTDDELAAYHQLNEQLLSLILAKHKLDVLHANHVVYQPIAAIKACQSSNTPLIIFPHGSAIEYTVKRDERYKRLALQGILASAGLIIGNNEVRDRILKLYPEHEALILAKSKIVGVGVDTTLFQPVPPSEKEASVQKLIATQGGGGKSPAQVQELQQGLAAGNLEITQAYWNAYKHALPDDNLNEQLRQIPWNKPILIFVGALTVGKGLQSLITALPQVLEQHPQAQLVIVGSGAYREVLEALVYAIANSKRELLLELCAKGQDLDRNTLTGPWEDVQHFLTNPVNLERTLAQGQSLEQQVHFLGRLDHARLRYLFPCADLAIFPSVVPEAYPLVLMESLANGVLPLVSYFSGFKDGVDALQAFLPASFIEKMRLPVGATNRVATIAHNLNGLLADERLKTIKPKLRQIAVENYDWELRATQMVEAYEALV